MKDLILVAKHAFGHGSRCNHVDIVTVPDEHGGGKEHILHPVGQHVALTRIEDGEMKMIREVIAIALAPTGKTVAVSECVGRCVTTHAQESDLSEAPSTSFQRSNDAHEKLAEPASRTNTKLVHAHINIYHLYSGTRLRTLSLPAQSNFICLAFSPDSKRIAAVTAGERTSTSAERPTLAVWQLDKDSIEATATIPAGHVTQLGIIISSNGKLCFTTSGKQHFRLWILAESGLKMQSVLPSSRERSENFVDHQWAVTKARAESLNETAGVRLKSAVSGRSTDSNSESVARLLLLTSGSLRNNSPSQATARPGHAADATEVHEASVMIFGSIESHPYLELISTQIVPLNGEVHLETLTVHARGFCIAGTQGYFAAFECQDDPKSPYLPVRSFLVVGSCPNMTLPSWVKLAVSPNGETLVAYARDHTLYTFPLGSIDVLTTDENGGLGEHFSPLVSGGGVPHDGPILAMDLGVQRPLIATCGADHTVRVWNYTRRRCELVHCGGQGWSSDKPSCLALHPSGFQLIIGFPERVRLFSVLFQALKLLHELPLIKCHEVRYAHGGHQFACAAGVTVIIYSAISMAQLQTFTGHLLPVRCIIWGGDDLSLFSAGADGNVYGWDLVDMARIEEASQLNHASPYHAIAAHIPPRGGSLFNGLACTHSAARVIGASTDGILKEVCWNVGTGDIAQTRDLKLNAEDSGDLNTGANSLPVIFTALAVASSSQFLFAGTSSGAIRAFDWPTIAAEDGSLRDYYEFPAHAGNIIALRIAAEDSLLLSAGDDGVVFVFMVHSNMEKQSMPNKTFDVAVLSGKLESALIAPNLAHGADIVQVSLEELEENANAVAEMTKRLENQRSENDFALHRKDLDWEAELKHAQDEREGLLAAERVRFEELQDRHEKSMREYRADAARKGSHHIQVTHELENQYEHKLALEMERYDRLSEEIEAIQQRCEGLLEAQQREHETAIRNAEGRTKRVEKELRQQIDRLHEDAKHNEQMFREVLDQQEHEYETELQQLMAAAQAELTAERENTAEARGLVQTRNTKISRLEKRMDELKTSSHARNVLLTAEKVRNAKLEATLRHFKRHMEERESTLEDKELSILRLRRKNVTLDNFRFVLDHRVQQLMEERGPITHHVGGLEAHISAMYDELESEYYEKKRQGQQLDSKELKIHTLGQEVTALRGLLREREAYIASFKRELSTLVGFTTPKDLEDAIKDAYHRFVKDEAPRHKSTKKNSNMSVRASPNTEAENATSTASRSLLKQPSTGAHGSVVELDDGVTVTDIDPDMIHDSNNRKKKSEGASLQQNVELDFKDALVEAHSQRNCVQRAAGNLKHRLNIAKADAERLQRVKLGENSHLIAECNQLRGEHLSLSREVKHLRQVVKDYNSAVTKRRNRIRSAKNEHGKPALLKTSDLDQHNVVALENGPHTLTKMVIPGCPRTTTRSNIDAALRGSTRSLGLWSEQEARITQMASQLDENSRVIGTQRIEIQSLRAQVLRLDEEKCQNNKPTHISTDDAPSTSSDKAGLTLSKTPHVHLGLFPQPTENRVSDQLFSPQMSRN